MRELKPMEINEVWCFFREYIGRIIIILGVFFIFIAVLLMSRVYQWNFSIFFLLGVALMIVGSALHFESFKWKVPSLRGLGTILMYISPFFMALAVVAMVFAVPEEAVMMPIYGEHGSSNARFMVVLLRRPYVWLAEPFMLTGLVMLIFGFLLKLASDAL